MSDERRKDDLFGQNGQPCRNGHDCRVVHGGMGRVAYDDGRGRGGLGRGRGRGRGHAGGGGRGGDLDRGAMRRDGPQYRQQGLWGREDRDGRETSAHHTRRRSPEHSGAAGTDFQYLRVSDGIVGVCTEVERRYVRVQSQPDPASVRPSDVLRKSLQAVAQREAAGEPYEVTSDFHMSICQDLRLQQIEDGLTVAAREAFALCAMRARVGPPGASKSMDVKTLTSCLLHLQDLYAKNPGQPRQLEFTVYRFLLWLGLVSATPDDSTNTMQLHASLKGLAAFAPHVTVAHAWQIMSAVLTGDAHTYFSLTAAPPDETGHQSHIHDTLLAPVVRARMFDAIRKAYKFSIPLEAVRPLLGMSGQGLGEWLAQERAVFDEQALDVDESVKQLKALKGEDKEAAK